jgi:hypothetical protein
LQIADFNQMTEELMREAGILQQLEQSAAKEHENADGQNESSSSIKETKGVTDEQKAEQQNVEQIPLSSEQQQQQCEQQVADEKQPDNKGEMQLDAER